MNNKQQCELKAREMEEKGEGKERERNGKEWKGWKTATQLYNTRRKTDEEMIEIRLKLNKDIP
jgi:hypothetical protein